MITFPQQLMIYIVSSFCKPCVMLSASISIVLSFLPDTKFLYFDQFCLVIFTVFTKTARVLQLYI